MGTRGGGGQKRGPSPLGLGSHGLCDGVALHEQVQGLGGTAHHGGGQAVGEEVGAGALAEQIDEGFGACCVPACRGRKGKWARHPQGDLFGVSNLFPTEEILSQISPKKKITADVFLPGMSTLTSRATPPGSRELSRTSLSHVPD